MTGELMARNTLTLRRHPRQERAQSLVNDVLTATIKVIDRVGYQEANTNLIARMAGVSVGSLYQYFPNKKVIFAKLIERLEDDKRSTFIDITKSVSHLAPIHQVTPVVTKIMDQVFKERQLLNDLYRHASELDRLEYIAQSQASVAEDLSRVLQKHHEAIKPRDHRLAAFIVTNSFCGVVEALVRDDVDEDRWEAAKVQLITLIKSYLFLPQGES